MNKEIENIFNAQDEELGKLVYIPIGRLEHHPNNPRKDLGDLSELSDSIRKNGIFQNLTVVPAKGKDSVFYVVIGNRRMEASKLAGLTELPCVISDMTENEQVITMLAENMQRNDLTVFEQAWGFQLAMDLGESEQTISEKSGFSVKTVKRRLQLAKLDQEKLKKVSDRQISMAELDALSTVESLEERNNLLHDLGTSNFDYRLKQIIKRQNQAKKEAKWEKFFLEKGLKKIPYNEVHSGKYSSAGNHGCFVLDSCGMDDFSFKGDEQYFAMNCGYAYIRKDLTEEEKRERAYRTTNNREREYRCELLREIKKTCYELRREFVFSITEINAKKAFVLSLKMAMRPDWDTTFERAYYCRYDSAKFLKNESDSTDGSLGFEKACRIVDANPYQSLLRHAYVASGDSEKLGYHDWQGDHQQNERLDAIYEFLESLGYDPADEELQYKDGTHKLFLKETIDA